MEHQNHKIEARKRWLGVLRSWGVPGWADSLSYKQQVGLVTLAEYKHLFNLSSVDWNRYQLAQYQTPEETMCHFRTPPLRLRMPVPH